MTPERRGWTRAIVALALVLVAACAGDDPSGIGGAGSEVVVDVAEPGRAVPPAAYAITYRVEELDHGDVRTTTAELLVERPFRSRLTIFDGGDVVSDRAADFAYLGEDTSILAPPPQPAPGDIRGDLVFAGDDATGTRRVAGRTCWVHRLGAAITEGVVTPGDTTDVCVDGDGLVLEEVVTDGDRVTRRWVATDVDTSPVIDDGDFRVDGATPVPVDDGGGSVREIEPTSRSVGQFWEVPDPPPGFTHRGRYAVVPPQAARTDDSETRAQVVAGVVDVWVRGIDLLLVDQGGTLGRVPPFGATPNSDLVDLGALAETAEVFVTPTGSEIRVLIPPGRYVRLAGTFAADDLVAIARSLQEVEGDGLVYVTTTIASNGA